MRIRLRYRVLGVVVLAGMAVALSRFLPDDPSSTEGPQVKEPSAAKPRPAASKGSKANVARSKAAAPETGATAEARPGARGSARQLDCNAPGGTLAGLEVLFKIDPRITRGLYMGDRWVAGPKISAVQNGATVVVAAKAQGRNAAGRAVTVGASWHSLDPGVATVTTAPSSEAIITAARPGRTKVVVECGELSTELDVNVRSEQDVLHAEIVRETQ